jgi:hypothetical protein
MEDYSTRINKLQTQVGSLEDELAALTIEANSTKSEIDSAVEKVPYISLLIFQNTVARLLSINSLRYYSEGNRQSKLGNVLQGIIAGIDHCKSEDFQNLPNENIKFIIGIVADLKIGLQFAPIRYSFHRALQEKIDDFAISLEQFKIENRDRFPELFSQMEGKLTEIRAALIS